MVQENASPTTAEEGSPWLRPWRVLLIALGAVVIGSLLVSYDDGSVVTPLRLLLIIAGLIAGGWAVQRQLNEGGETLDERVESAGLIAVYSFCGLVGFLGMAEPWFSGRIFFAFFISVSIVGSLLVLMPRIWRRMTVFVLILLHFLGVVVMATSTPATDGQMPWLPMRLSNEIYRPYLTGLYLNNAYHFYAPDPGSSTLVWIRIEYEDGEKLWLKLPDKQSSITPLHYQREMGIAENTSSGAGPMPDPQIFERLYKRRDFAGSRFAVRGRGIIPLRSDRMPQAQYNPPSEYGMAMMSSMARHVCRFYPHPRDPGIPVRGVKIYRLSYTIISPTQLLKGEDPLSDDLKLPFFMGNFDTDGHLLTRVDIAGKPLPYDRTDEGEEDPFLNWAVPMQYLARHAGDEPLQKSEEDK